MQEEVIKKARVLLGAGVDEDTIISTLNISLSDLENIKNDGLVQRAGAPLLQNKNNGKFVGKVTPDNYQALKQLVMSKPTTAAVPKFCEENDISLPTYYRIRRYDTYEEYRNSVNEESRKSQGSNPRIKVAKKTYMTRERYNKIKAELSDWNGSASSYCRKTGVSHTSAWRVNSTNSFEEYIEKFAPKYKSAEPIESGKLTLEEAVKIVEPYAIPKEEPKAEAKIETIQIAQPQEIKFTTPQIEALERIATQLERLADYEQMKLSKKRWFRKAGK